MSDSPHPHTETGRKEELSTLSTPTRKGIGPWGFLLGLGILITVAGLAVFFYLSERTAQMTDTVISAIRPEITVQTFSHFRDMEVQSNQGNILEVATANATETFERKTQTKLFGVSIGENVSKITIPATYRYHINLQDNWNVSVNGGRVYVVAPAIKPSLPVAFDTTGVEKVNESGILVRDSGHNMRELERLLTPELAIRAGSEQSLKKVREESRKAVAHFVNRWLLSHSAWSQESFNEIVVVFADEESQAIIDMAPSLRLNREPVETNQPAATTVLP